MTKLGSGIQIAHPSINIPELEETTCIKCGDKFLSEDRRRIRYCSKCRKIVNSKSHKLGLASESVDYHKIFEHLEPNQKRRMRTNKRNPCSPKRVDYV
jgi:ribosomal protein L37AE/L43A